MFFPRSLGTIGVFEKDCEIIIIEEHIYKLIEEVFIFSVAWCYDYRLKFKWN